LAAIGPIAFGRPVTLPAGGEAEARFQVFQWPKEERPAGLGIFACQHLTRENVWIPELQRHANGASRIVRVEVLAHDPAAAAAKMARLLDQEASAEADGAIRVATGGGRADLVFLTRAGLARGTRASRWTVCRRKGARRWCSARRTSPPPRARSARRAPTVAVPPSRATGVLLRFVAD
jgi:hypothetical protein